MLANAKSKQWDNVSSPVARVQDRISHRAWAILQSPYGACSDRSVRYPTLKTEGMRQPFHWESRASPVTLYQCAVEYPLDDAITHVGNPVDMFQGIILRQSAPSMKLLQLWCFDRLSEVCHARENV
jgi:hypothetical protein